MNVLRFLRWMSERGWGTYLYASPDSTLYQHAEAENIPVRPIKANNKYNSLFSIRQLGNFIKQDNVRILSIEQSRDMIPGHLAKIYTGNFYKVVYSQHMHIGGNKNDFYHRWLYHYIDIWITTGDWLADRVVEKTIIPREKIRIIPRGIELEMFTTKRPSKSDARHKLNLPADDIIIGVVGRLDPKKCQDTVVKALARIHQTGNKPHLALIGSKTKEEETGYEAVLKKLVIKNNLQNYVHFVEHQKQTENIYAALDIFIMASESETYGMVTIEAFASGLAVIGTASGGTLDIITHEYNGLLYEPHNDLELSIMILRYLKDENLKTRLAKQASEDALNIYSHNKQCEDWEKVFKEIL